MHDRFSYALEKLHQLVNTLSTHPGRIKERLLAGMMVAHTIQGGDFPDELREIWNEIYEQLTAVEPEGDEGRFAASINQMVEDTAIEIADRLVELTLRAEELETEMRNR
jgi:hypothetical protein